MKKAILVLCFTLLSTNLLAQRDKIVVLQFENTSKNKNYDYLSNSIPDLVSSSIADLKRFEVIRSGVLKKATADLDIKKDAVNDNAQKIARELKADIFIVGSFTAIQNRLVITGKIYGTKGDTVLAGATEQGRIDTSIFQTMDHFVKKMSSSLDKVIPKKEVVVKYKDKVIFKDREVTDNKQDFYNNYVIFSQELLPPLSNISTPGNVFSFEYQFDLSQKFVLGVQYKNFSRVYDSTGAESIQIFAFQGLAAGLSFSYFPFAISFHRGWFIEIESAFGIQNGFGFHDDVTQTDITQYKQELSGFQLFTIFNIGYRVMYNNIFFSDFKLGAGHINLTQKYVETDSGTRSEITSGQFLNMEFSLGVRI